MAQKYIDINQDLIERCRTNDKGAQYELYHLYAKPMYNICMRIVNHEGEAEDILQEAFLQAFRSLNDFRQESTFGAWLKRIVVNRSVSYMRKRKIDLTDHIPDNEVVMQDNDDNILDTQLEVRKISRAIQELPDGYRVVLSLYLLEGYDHAEIAQILNITESTSKSQYNRAKNRLRTQLSKL